MASTLSRLLIAAHGEDKDYPVVVTLKEYTDATHTVVGSQQQAQRYCASPIPPTRVVSSRSRGLKGRHSIPPRSTRTGRLGRFLQLQMPQICGSLVICQVVPPLIGVMNLTAAPRVRPVTLRRGRQPVRLSRPTAENRANTPRRSGTWRTSDTHLVVRLVGYEREWRPCCPDATTTVFATNGGLRRRRELHRR